MQVENPQKEKKSKTARGEFIIVPSILYYLRFAVREAYLDALKKYATADIFSIVEKLSDTEFWRFGVFNGSNEEYENYSLQTMACRKYKETQQIVNKQTAKGSERPPVDYPQISGEFFIESKIKKKIKDGTGCRVKHISEYLDFIGVEGSDFNHKIRVFIKKAAEKSKEDEYKGPEITESDKRKQAECLSVLGKTPEYSKPSETEKNSILNRFKDTSDWWFYFYGYEIDDVTKETLQKQKRWQLIRLVLTIEGTKFNPNGKVKASERIKVTLKNTIDGTKSNRHFDFKGDIDLAVSSNKVLVMNLRTTPYNSRQLNVKLSVPNPWETFFVGQYLNYDNEGEVYSGTVIIEQIKEENPEPKIYNITNDLKFDSSSEQEEVGHIAAYFQDRALNFRRSPKNIHNIYDFQEWINKKDDQMKT